jgi:hypothetical protein
LAYRVPVPGTTAVRGPTLLTWPTSVSGQSTHPDSVLVENIICGIVTSPAMERPGRYCVCGHPACKKPVKAGGHRMSCFTGDHLKVVVSQMFDYNKLYSI